MSGNTQGALFALLAFAIFSTHDVIVKILGAGYSAFQIVFFSVLFGFPLITLMLIRDSASENLRPRHPWWTALRTAATTITGLTIFYAFSVLPLTQVYAIIFAMPLLITVLSIPILGEQVRMRRWVAVIVGLCGVLIVLRPGSAELGLGHAAAMIGAVTGALASVIVRKIGKDERNVVLLLFPMLANFAIMGAAMPFVYKPMPVADLGLVAIMAAMAFAGSALVIRAYKAGEAVVVAPMQYSQIIWATIFGYALFDEGIDLATGIGALVIIGSGVYIVLRESRGGASGNTPVLRTRSRAETGTSFRVSSILRTRKDSE